MSAPPPPAFPPDQEPAAPSRHRLVAGLFGLGVLALAARFLWPQFSDVGRVYFFSEYALKIAPYFTDHAFTYWFDTWALGDPRPRLITLVAQGLNLTARHALPDAVAWHPALGVAWLLYPIVLHQLFRTLRESGADKLTAASAALLWAFSPPALDSLVLCYLPAKALMNLWFVLALKYAGRLARGADTPDHPLQHDALRLGGVILAAALTDETALVMVVAVLAIAWPFARFWQTVPRHRQISLAARSFALPAVTMAILTLVLWPALNRSLGQVPMNFIGLAAQGPSVAMSTATAESAPTSTHLANLRDNVHPAYLAFVAAGAHFLPHRTPPGYWTASSAPALTQWPLDEVGPLAIVLALLVLGAALLAPRERAQARRLEIGLVLMTLAYAVLLVPLAPAIVEVNYYGALFSLPIAWLVALVCRGPGDSCGRQLLAVALVVGVAAAQAAGYEATSRRTQAFFADGGLSGGNPTGLAPWDRDAAQAIAARVRAGDFADVIAEYRFPSPGFIFAFEQAGGVARRAGELIDFTPGLSPASPYALMLEQQAVWLRSMGIDAFAQTWPPDVATLLQEGGSLLDRATARALLEHHTWRGTDRYRHFERTYTSAGHFSERYWLRSVSRVWLRHGRTSGNDANTLLTDTIADQGAADSPVTLGCTVDHLYLAFDEEGQTLWSFRAETHLTP